MRRVVHEGGTRAGPPRRTLAGLDQRYFGLCELVKRIHALIELAVQLGEVGAALGLLCLVLAEVG